MMPMYSKFCCGALILLLLMSAVACDGAFGKESFPQPDVQTGQGNHQTPQTSAPETNGQSTAAPEPPSTEKNTEKPTEEPTTETNAETSTEKVTEQPTETVATEPPVQDQPIVTPSDLGYTYPEMEEDLAALDDRYGAYFSYQSIGKSVDGREIYACVVGNPNAGKKVLVSGGIHGKEYLSSLVVMTQMEYYLSCRETGSYHGMSYAELLESYAFYVLPMINPDGIMLALCGIESMQTAEARAAVEKVYAANLRDGLTGAQDINVYLAYNWKANANGVDLNRNFALSNWADVKTGILSPCFRNYKGPRAASEPETQAVSAYVESIGEIESLLAFHTAGQVVYWDCGVTGGVRQQTYDLAAAVCEHTGYKLIYDKHLDASLNDWITLEKGVPSVTIEIANVIYPMPTSELEDAFAQTKELWVVAAQLFG